ncbi:LPXTG cell wall anchor domain-containing protein [Rummeliibacillus sp. TYF005]|uniref:LPXTG cell wall anchor domain-containing protein n=1 Tax=unclassified Rummeliibacillus TaxID=2622809 RepID=UPI000E667F47|nr:MULTISPECIES: LPXTG cell wall anchor domain-containing protein [unclassified Rummeliibacillus]RIJ64833.1 LPXTG cell wall anchor domain-containing protein [Rummeliibacillus sp. POC4]RPJ97428.1 LPXTG cell wall anchor domain-containing protein [Rummeliibacillus sp. TYF005]
MIKQYIFVLMLSVFVITFNFSHSITANAETSITQTNSSTYTTASNSTDAQQKISTDTNKAKFVQDTLPQTGVEANHSGLYFTIAGFFLLLAVFTSRSKSSRQLKQKK